MTVTVFVARSTLSTLSTALCCVAPTTSPPPCFIAEDVIGAGVSPGFMISAATATAYVVVIVSPTLTLSRFLMFSGTCMVNIFPSASFSSISRVLRSTDWTVVGHRDRVADRHLGLCARAEQQRDTEHERDSERLSQSHVASPEWLGAIRADPAARAK